MNVLVAWALFISVSIACSVAKWRGSVRRSDGHPGETGGRDAIPKRVSEEHGDAVRPSDTGEFPVPHAEREDTAAVLVFRFDGQNYISPWRDSWADFCNRVSKFGSVRDRSTFWFRVGEQLENRGPDPVGMR
jgi:hypothetical protein